MRPVFHLNTGDDLLEAETIMNDVIKRRRRIFGSAHPATLQDQKLLSIIRVRLSRLA